MGGMKSERLQMGRRTLMDNPEGSVVIPCFDGEATLGLQLEALATQQAAPPFEVIVVDNRSTDGTRSVVKKWQSTLPNLRLVVADDEAGAGYARNVGAGAAIGQYLMFCGSSQSTV